VGARTYGYRRTWRKQGCVQELQKRRYCCGAGEKGRGISGMSSTAATRKAWP